MWTRNLLILACCLVPSSALAAFGGVPEGAEVIPAPAPRSAPASSPQMAMPMSDGTACGRSRHAADIALVLLVGHLALVRQVSRPRATLCLSSAVARLVLFPTVQRRPIAGAARGRHAVGRRSSQSLCHGHIAATAATGPGACRVRTLADEKGCHPKLSVARRRPRRLRPPAGIIPWPPVLCDPRFAYQRATIEAPFRHSLQGQGNPAAEDYQGIIDAVEQMKAILRQITAEISVREGLSAERFLDQLAAEAREEAHVQLASASSEPGAK